MRREKGVKFTNCAIGSIDNGYIPSYRLMGKNLPVDFLYSA